MKCRICEGELREYLDLGLQPPSDKFVTWEQFSSEQRHPLSVCYCEGCSLSQLSYVVPKEELYDDSYPYETRMNTQGVRHFNLFAKRVGDRFVKDTDLVVDIGSNDGTLLSGFKGVVCGVEPVKHIAENACVPTINRFFDTKAVNIILAELGEAKVVTATNVFAHIDDVHSLVKNIKRLLIDDGVLVIEAPYLINLVEGLQFDTIYHEHLSYLSLTPLVKLFGMHDMELFDCEWFPIHGGSMRYFVCNKGEYPVNDSIQSRMWQEGKYTLSRLKSFGNRVYAFRDNLMDILYTLKKDRNSIVGVSAPAKGNTLLNFCGIDSSILDYITEKSKLKIGKYTPGTHIEVVEDLCLLRDQPDYALVLAWNWYSQITENLRREGYRGDFIAPTEDGIKDFCRRSQWFGRFEYSPKVTQAGL